MVELPLEIITIIISYFDSKDLFLINRLKFINKSWYNVIERYYFDNPIDLQLKGDIISFDHHYDDYISIEKVPHKKDGKYPEKVKVMMTEFYLGVGNQTNNDKERNSNLIEKLISRFNLSYKVDFGYRVVFNRSLCQKIDGSGFRYSYLRNEITNHLIEIRTRPNKITFLSRIGDENYEIVIQIRNNALIILKLLMLIKREITK